MSPALPPHQIRRTWPLERLGECARCGRVSIKSGGSDRHGGQRWRCANQVNEYRKRKAQKDRKDKGTKSTLSDYGFTLVWPCCEALEPMEPPSLIDQFGGASDEYYGQCPACQTARILRVVWFRENDYALLSAVSFIDVEQHYDGGALESTLTAKEALSLDNETPLPK